MIQPANETITDLLPWLPAGIPDETSRLIKKAIDFINDHHKEKLRDFGDTYVQHDVAVAHIISQLGHNNHTLVAALLHDIDIDNPNDPKTQEQLRAFPADVLNLVTSLNALYAYTEKDKKRSDATHVRAARIHRAILRIIDQDIKVIILCMADCLADLRRAPWLKDEQKRLELATEAQTIYAPLANRLGIWQLKWEIEDQAFRLLHPEQYREIARKLDQGRASRHEKVQANVQKLQSRLAEMGVKAKVIGRPKHIYSIYRKMERKHVDFGQVYDVQALRVILDTQTSEKTTKSPKQRDDETRTLCYQVLGAVHSLWKPIPQEFDDYIATPKANGYRSLHTAVMDEFGQHFEVQIRTDEMDRWAELGVASHWLYKESGQMLSASEVDLIERLRKSAKALNELAEGSEDLELMQQELLAERIYVFTPRGDVIDLPAGATPIDFAYQIHTEIGHRCRGAKINEKMVSLDYHLRSGQKVEIITASRGGPNRDWMNENLGFTRSARTRSKIRQWFRQQERGQNITQGKEVVERELRRLNLSDVYTIEDIAKALHIEEVDLFLAKVGFGDIQTSQIGGAISALQQKLRPDDELRPLLQSQPPVAKQLTVQGISGLYHKMAACCNPIPPAPIVGYITRGRGITIHLSDCKTLLTVSEKDRLIEVAWGQEEERYPIPIVIRAYRRPGLVDDVANVLKGRKIPVSKTKTITAESIITISLLVEVRNIGELDWLLERLDKLPNVQEARRQRWKE